MAADYTDCLAAWLAATITMGPDGRLHASGSRGCNDLDAWHLAYEIAALRIA